MKAENNYQEIYKGLSKKYMLASLFLLAIFAIKQIAIFYQVSDQTDMANVINEAGRQRMLSQKIIKETLYIQNNELINNHSNAEELKGSLELWNTSHVKLVSRSSEGSTLKKENREAIGELFAIIEPHFNKINTDVKLILETIENEQQPFTLIKENIAELKTSEKIYLETMEQIVSQYQHAYEQNLQNIKLMDTILLLIIVGLLLFMGMRIFLPIDRALRKAFWDVNESNENIQEMFHSMKGAFFIVNDSGQILNMNDEAEQMTGEQIPSTKALHIVQAVHWLQLNVIEMIEEVSKGTRIDGIETEIEVPTGEILTVIVSAFKVRNDRGIKVAISLFDITLQKKAENMLKNIANKDELTRLYNRHFLYSIVDEEIERAERLVKPLSVILFDLDFFKKINDHFGHPVGDEILKFTAELVQENSRELDYVIRFGGEEFIILMPSTSLLEAVALAEKLRKLIGDANHPVTGKFTASFGVAERLQGEGFKKLYERVDAALYRAKETGRNRVIRSEI